MMIREYLDRSILSNPVSHYFKWLINKSMLQLRYWGKHLRIGYLSRVSNCVFERYNWVGSNCILLNCQLADFSYINDFSYILNTRIGKYCSIGPNVKIAPGSHPSSVFVSTHPVTFNNQSNFVRNFVTENHYKSFKQVTIGNDVWVGANAIIMDGVNIADGAIIAAGAIVVKDVGPYEIVGGNPARFIKRRFSEGEISNLLETKWWNKDIAWIERNISRFRNIQDFIKYTNHKIYAVDQEVI